MGSKEELQQPPRTFLITAVRVLQDACGFCWHFHCSTISLIFTVNGCLGHMVSGTLKIHMWPWPSKVRLKRDTDAKIPWLINGPTTDNVAAADAPHLFVYATVHRFIFFFFFFVFDRRRPYGFTYVLHWPT